ncbi:hypothetical protein HNY73_007126 [Argiope bruennichi]|uniref:Uncharacterized protein n=1 Tax=Argiope bruennichi TaxID=94029 RepID=A0A8T0FFM6_ARGBR|nr:hypothetical protein HNY73_007126 [Argiope bruennichi]
MDNEEARGNSDNSENRRLSIERFAYDVFSYMLPLCGFPETAIPDTNFKQNVYDDENFVKKAGLLVLLVSMHMRDAWKTMFEMKYMLTRFTSLEMIQNFLIRIVEKNEAFRVADEATKVQVSLALYNEMILFLDYKSLETHVASLATSWSKFYLKCITEDSDIEKILESSFLVFPEVSKQNGERIIGFIKEFAVPYGHLNKVSQLFEDLKIQSSRGNAE